MSGRRPRMQARPKSEVDMPAGSGPPEQRRLVTRLVALAMAVVVLLASGRVVATGTTGEIRSNPVVQEVYLGHSERTR